MDTVDTVTVMASMDMSFILDSRSSKIAHSCFRQLQIQKADLN